MEASRASRPRRPGAISTSALDLTDLRGLPEAEAVARLRREGANELPAQRKRGCWRIVARGGARADVPAAGRAPAPSTWCWATATRR